MKKVIFFQHVIKIFLMINSYVEYFQIL